MASVVRSGKLSEAEAEAVCKIFEKFGEAQGAYDEVMAEYE